MRISGTVKKCVVMALAVAWTVMRMQAQSPYINRVYDFMPAPGQFVNDIPAYEAGDTRADMIRKAEEAIAHNRQGMISLGGYGGYVVFGFDHEVENRPGRYDFRILGNAFYADANPNAGALREGGSSEPGIVMVSRDANGNGLPDDPWYELAGSEYSHPQTVHNYRITYYRPDESKPRVPHPTDPALNDVEYIRWTTNVEGSGYLFRNVYHSQSYYPRWIEDGSLTFEGTKLAGNGVDESGQGRYYVLYALHWGYADNRLNSEDRSCFSIDRAVDGSGNRVALPGIHFVKVYTGVNQYCGWLGETSTEILGAEDLHLTNADAAVPVFAASVSLNRTSVAMQPGEHVTLTATVAPANATDRRVTWLSDNEAAATVSATGTVTAVAPGRAAIRAVALDGYYVAACQVTVSTGSQPGPGPDPGPDPDPQPGGTSVTGVTLNRTQLALHPGDIISFLDATVAPSTATNKAVSWHTSDPAVAEVTVNGTVIAFVPGTAVITVTTDDGRHSATCRVTVSDPSSATATVDAPPSVRHDGQALHLRNLDGYECLVVGMDGRVLHAFGVASPDERRTCALPPGVYILHAQKQGDRKTFKFAVK